MNQNNNNNIEHNVSNNHNDEPPKDNKDEKEDNNGEVIKISEELDKPDELNKDSTDNDYIKIINDKMKKYKRELDNSVYQIENHQKELIEQEKKFNNFIEAINISNKIINNIKDNLNSNTRDLKEICTNEEKIINDLDEIEKKLDERIKGRKNKEEIVKKNEIKNKEIEKCFNNIGTKIEKCHEIMETKNNVIENTEIKTLNQLLNRIHCRIKKVVQGKQINYIKNIFEAEKNNIIENKFFI